MAFLESLAERETKEFFKRQSVVNLVFQLRIGIDVKPFLQQQAFKQQQRGIGTGAFVAGADGVMIQ